MEQSTLSPPKQKQPVRNAALPVPPCEIPRRPDPLTAPLSFAQYHMWVIDQMTPGNPAYNLPNAFRLRGALNLKALEESFNQVIARHETLRTTFGTKDGELLQFIHPQLRIQLD